MNQRMHGPARPAALLALFLVLLLLTVLHYSSIANRIASLPQTQLLNRDTHVQSSSVSPLEPWLHSEWNVTTMPSCFRVRAAEWGIASSFNNILWAATIIQQLKPGTNVYYDHFPSYYQCSDNKTIDAFLSPVGNFIKIGTPPEDCYIMDFERLLGLVQHFMVEKWKSSFIWESYTTELPYELTPQQRLDRRMLLNSAFQALCPVVNDWWNLAPELQTQVDKIKQQLQGKDPIVAIHARGGDKASELGRYMDNRTQQYPMQLGMQRLVKMQPALKQASPICVIFGDDYAYAQIVEQWAVGIIGCARVVMRTPTVAGTAYTYNAFKKSPLWQRCAETKQYLVDIELMAWATYLVGNHRANGDTLAVYMRKCKYYHDSSTAVPGTGATYFPLWH